MTESIQDKAMRYIKDALAAGVGNHPEWTIDELNEFREFVNARFTEDENIVLHVYDSIVREFGQGHRCGVCGRTSAQNEAIGYDCVREC